MAVARVDRLVNELGAEKSHQLIVAFRTHASYTTYGAACLTLHDRTGIS